MKRSLKNLLTFNIKETDGEKGSIKDFLFDEDKWIVRYLEVGLGNIFNDRKVLVEKSFLDQPDFDNRTFPVKLTKKQIEEAPKLSEHLPVSLKYEEEYNKHYRLVNYWDLPYSSIETTYPPRPIRIPTKDFSEDDLDTKLRSFKEVENYHIHAKDGIFGHIHDLIVDDEDWQIVYAIVDTSKWMLWSRNVIIPINQLTKISYIKREVEINLSIEKIKNSPEYQEEKPMESDYEKALYDFYIKTL